MTDRADGDLDQGLGEADTLVDALAQTTFVVTAVLLRVGAEHDLSLTQLRVLGILRDRDGVRVTSLAHRLGLEKSTMTGLVDRAVRRGLLERRPSPDDGRAVDVLITPSGRRLAVQLYDAVAVALTGMTDRLAPAEQRRLTVLLRRLLAPDR